MGIHQTTEVGCPLCGNSWKFVHTYHTVPTFGKCEKCGYNHVTGYSPRSQIEHRRPKTIPDSAFYGSSDHE